MILGSLIIIVASFLAVKFVSRKGGETLLPVETSEEQKLPTLHRVKSGENLWTISEKYYGTGYNWVDIAQENNLKNPSEIVEGETLKIPNVEPRKIKTEEFQEVEKGFESEVKEATQPKTHIVARGENLWKIAETYYQSGYNWIDIAKENKLKNPNIIYVGQEILIPNVSPRYPQSMKSAKVEERLSPITGSTYKIQKGDNLWNISLRAYGDGYKWVELAKVNNIKNPNLIHSGVEISIPR